MVDRIAMKSGWVLALPQRRLLLRKMLVASIALLFSLLFVGLLNPGSAYAFNARTSAPQRGNSWYYSSANPYYSAGYVGQCTWYAQGRASEILGTKYIQKGYGSGGDFWRNNSGHPTGQTPKVGALACAGRAGAGHVAVVEAVHSNGSFSVSEYYGSGDRSFHYNTYSNGDAWAKSSTRGAWSFQGFIYLVDEGSAPRGEMTVPTISLGADWYQPGSTVAATWPATSADTDFYQYWVILTNTTENRTVFAGATGNARDVWANRFSYKVDSAGTYSLTVYAVPYNNKDARQRACTKEFTVGAKGQMTVPTISLDADWYQLGSTVTATWAATSADTDFYQYWAILTNATENKVVYSGATGSARDVWANKSTFKVDSAGTYSLTVYAVPYGNKDARQKSSVKWFTVGAVKKVEVPKAVSGLVYTGNKLTGVRPGTGCKVTGGTATNAGSYRATVSLQDGYRWSDGSTGSKTVSWSIAKAIQSHADLHAVEKTVKKSAVAKANVVAVKLFITGVADSAPVSFSKVLSESSSKLSVGTSSGNIIVKKGAKRGTYSIKVRANVGETDNYKAMTWVVTAKIKVK